VLPPATRPPTPRFDRRFFTGEETFTTVGGGSLGGKALGLAFARDHILTAFDAAPFPGVELVVPTLTVLGTDLFDAFLERNHLHALVATETSDERLAHAFQRADLPAESVGDLLALIEQVHTPLAIRSSSLLEDALAHPFAGVYTTKMLPNNQPSAQDRFARLVEAVKLVYASTFFASAQAYRRSLGATPGTEKMAVIIQEVVGLRHRDRFYPDVSGVARSYNYYPAAGSAPVEGVIDLALGLGKTIVDGGRCWTYSPARPTAPAPFESMQALLDDTQTFFWAVNMGPPPPYDPVHETEYLTRSWIHEARTDGTLTLLASTYDPVSDQVRPGVRDDGPLVLDFASLLGGAGVPLNDCLVELLAASRRALDQDVEIEFALSLSPERGRPARLGFLQVRPMAGPGERTCVDAADLEAPQVVLSTHNSLGNGQRDDIEDVVFIKPSTFSPEHTRTIARELSLLNQDLLRQGRRYLLIGFGRWGSSEPWLGVPVAWADIAGARVIVEVDHPGMGHDPSQGSHFFHNLIGFGVLYLSVPVAEHATLDWAWLERQECVKETRFVRHARTAAPLRIRVDGHSGRGVIARGDDRG